MRSFMNCTSDTIRVLSGRVRWAGHVAGTCYGRSEMHTEFCVETWRKDLQSDLSHGHFAQNFVVVKEKQQVQNMKLQITFFSHSKPNLKGALSQTYVIISWATVGFVGLPLLNLESVTSLTSLLIPANIKIRKQVTLTVTKITAVSQHRHIG